MVFDCIQSVAEIWNYFHFFDGWKAGASDFMFEKGFDSDAGLRVACGIWLGGGMLPV